MEPEHTRSAADAMAEQPSEDASAPVKTPWQEPKLAFIEPTLTPHGTLEEVMGAFFGGFTPAPQ